MYTGSENEEQLNWMNINDSGHLRSFKDSFKNISCKLD